MILWLLACPAPEPGLTVEADPAWFADEVEPVLQARCANPSCHGAPRPLEVYAPGLHRAGDEPFGPLDDAEHAANLARAAAFLVGIAEPSETELLTRPLGAAGHVVQLEDEADPAWEALHTWAELSLEAP